MYKIHAFADLFAPSFSGSSGHGLGLWVTHQTVQQLGGRIEILDSAQGTVVVVCLPLGREETCPPLAGVAP